MPTFDVASRYLVATEQQIDLRRCVVTPGLINAHRHTGLILLRGAADDLPLLKWLTEAVWAIEPAFASNEAFFYDGTKLATAEMLRGGVTTFADMYFFPAATAKAAVNLGIRAIIGITVLSFPTAYDSGES